MTTTTTPSHDPGVAGTVPKATERIEDAARSAATQAREAAANVDAVAGNFRTALERSLRDQPETTLALACVIAFILGAMWKS